MLNIANQKKLKSCILSHCASKASPIIKFLFFPMKQNEFHVYGEKKKRTRRLGFFCHFLPLTQDRFCLTSDGHSQSPNHSEFFSQQGEDKKTQLNYSNSVLCPIKEEKRWRSTIEKKRATFIPKCTWDKKRIWNAKRSCFIRAGLPMLCNAKITRKKMGVDDWVCVEVCLDVHVRTVD